MEKKVFVIIMAVMFFGTFGLSIFHEGNVKELAGVYTKYEQPEFTYDSYMDGTYQSQMDNYYSANYSAHHLAVRMYNQFRYTLFHTSDSVVVGKNGYLYENSYIRERLGVEGAVLLSDEEIISLTEQVLRIQEEALSQGKGFLYIFTPSKADFVSENIPNRFLYMKQAYSEEQRNYIRLQKAFDKYGVRYLDISKLLAEEEFDEPVFYASGIHWTRSAAVYGLNAMNRELNLQYGYQIPMVEILEMIESPTTNDAQDQDLYRLLNVYIAKKDEVYYTPVEAVAEQKETDKLALFMQGGSFTNKLMDISGEHKLYAQAKQEFYAEWLQDYNVGTGVDTSDLSCQELRDAISEADIIILESNVENVAGLMPDMYDAIYQHLQGGE